MAFVTEIWPEDTFVIKVGDAFDFRVRHEFQQAFQKAPGGIKRYIVDFRDTLRIDSSGLDLLLQLRVFAGNQRERVELANACPDVRRVLLVMNFQLLFVMDGEFNLKPDGYS